MLHKAKKAYYACDLLPSINRLAARTGCAVHFSLFSRVTFTDEVSGEAYMLKENMVCCTFCSVVYMVVCVVCFCLIL